MRARFILALCCLGVLSVAVAAAQPSRRHHHHRHHASSRAAGKVSSKSDQARRNQVLASGGGIRITVGDVEDAINAQSPFLRARYQDQDKLKEFVDNMIRFKLLAKEAERQGYADKPAVVRTVKQNSVQQLIRKQFDEKITPQSVSDEAARKYYDEHSAEFRRPEVVRASHILFATEKDAEALLPKARKADMAGFAALARQHSIDTETKDRGGDLRYFTSDGRPPGSQDPPVDPAIVKAAFALKQVGDVVSRPIEVAGGHYSIVKLTGRRDAQIRTFEQAAPGIRLRLWQQERQKAVEDFVDSLRKKYAPKIYPNRMSPIKLDTAATSPGFPQQGSPAGGPAPSSAHR